MVEKWGGHKARKWSAAVLREGGTVCTLNLPGCTVVATTGDHIIPRHDRPDLQYVVANGRPACQSCNSRRKRRDLPPPQRRDDRSFFESRSGSAPVSGGSPPRAERKNL